MPDTWEYDEPVRSKPKVEELVRTLNATLHSGFDLRKTSVLNAIQNLTLFHYHGHIKSNPNHALESMMILNEAAFQHTTGPDRETLTAREFFQAKLGSCALVVLIGCGSGVSFVSSIDDVLGWPTALFFAGAGSVVSTLWPIEDDDGIVFAEAFYDDLRKQRIANKETGFLEVAQAVPRAALDLRSREGRQRPYHWAAFNLNGFWMLPQFVLSSKDE